MFWKLSKTTLVGVTALMMCVANGMEARAQRTMRGESLISLEAHYPFTSPYGLGGDLSYGQYLLTSFWKAGISVTEYTASPTDYLSLGYLHATAYGQWMYRLAGTRNRVLSLYAGGGVFLGYETVLSWNDLPDTFTSEHTSGQFLYGLVPSIEMEIFFSRKAALFLGASLPINFSSQFGHLHYQTGAGIRINM